MSWTISVPGVAAAEEITRLHRRAAQTGFAHIFSAEAPPPPFEDDLAGWQFWLGPDRKRGRHAYMVQLDGCVVGVVLGSPDPDDATVGHLWRLRVDPDRWGAGIGTALHRAAVAGLAGRGFPPQPCRSWRTTSQPAAGTSASAGARPAEGSQPSSPLASTTLSTSLRFTQTNGAQPAMLGEVEIRELIAGGADELGALFAAVLPDSQLPW